MSINRKTCLKWFKPIALLLLGAIIGITIFVLYLCLSKTKIVTQEKYDVWLISYYVFHIIGAVGTVLAVIVALSKESIMKWLYAPALKVSPLDEIITEVFPNVNQRVPEASSFEYYVKIENNGSLVAFGCKTNISDIKYGKSKSNVKSIKNANNKQLKWTSSGVDIPVNIPTQIKLFEITNPNCIGTPSANNDNQKPIIRFNGCELKKHQLEKGVWIIEYYISCKNGEPKSFIATIEWNGEFKSRANDMADVLKVQIKEK